MRRVARPLAAVPVTVSVVTPSAASAGRRTASERDIGGRPAGTLWTSLPPSDRLACQPVGTPPSSRSTRSVDAALTSTLRLTDVPGWTENGGDGGVTNCGPAARAPPTDAPARPTTARIAAAAIRPTTLIPGLVLTASHLVLRSIDRPAEGPRCTVRPRAESAVAVT